MIAQVKKKQAIENYKRSLIRDDAHVHVRGYQSHISYKISPWIFPMDRSFLFISVSSSASISPVLKAGEPSK